MAITLDGTNGILSPDFEPSGSTTPTNGLFLPTTNSLGFATNSTERLRLDASGNLGLGVTPSVPNTGKVFEVGFSGNGLWSRYQEEMYLSNNAKRDGATWKYSATQAASAYMQYAGQHVWYNAPSGTAGNAISFTQAMTLDASGNLGIGTTSPGFKLSVAGYSNVNPANKLAIGDVADYQARLYMESANETFTIENTSDYASSAILFRINGSERARIDSSGNLLVGTTSLTPTNGGVVTYGGLSGTEVWAGHASGTSGGVPYYAFYYAGSRIGSITQNGTSQVLYNTSSDQRLKENVADAPSALSSVNAIKVRSFDWKSDGSHVDYGYIAQELLEVAPEAVSVHEDPEQMMGVDFGKLTPRLVKAIQELTARLEALEAK